MSEPAAKDPRTASPPEPPMPVPGLAMATPPARAEPAARSPNSPAYPTSPAEQAGTALVATLKAADGTQSVTVQLHPDDLGAVHIRVDRTIGGLAHVAISADRPETLRLLRDDEAGLRRVLDNAGLPAEGRTVSFDSPPPQPVASPTRFDAPAHGGPGSNGQQMGGQQTGGQHMGSGGGGGRSGEPGPDSGREPMDRDQARARWARAGLDIVA